MEELLNIDFAHPYVLWCLLIIPLLAVCEIWRKQSKLPALIHSRGGQFAQLRKSWKAHTRQFLFALRLIALALLIVAMARPQDSQSWQDVTSEGIDIVVALDISSSMLARDFKPNRLEAAKETAIEFIQKRPNDRIGLVVYSGESFTQCPLTTDHEVLKNLLADIKNGMIEDGTAIGLGLANSVNRLKDSEAKSKVVILLTDGSNNTGSIPPLTASEIASAFDIRVYTIAVGRKGKAPFPVKDMFGRTTYQDMEAPIDEETLKKIAKQTQGEFFRATDNSSLEKIYTQIDKMEKSRFQVTEYSEKDEKFWPWAIAAAVLLAFEFLLNHTVLRSAFG